jgi:curved DNA-binding protein CbpA
MDTLEGPLAAEERKLFLDRIAGRLREAPLEIGVAAHRARIAELVRRLGMANHYQLLGVGPGAGAAEVAAAYEGLARLVHPHHARRLGLDGREGVLELLFERALHAFLTLSRPDLRKAYDRELGPERWRAEETAVRRPEEARQVARGYYERAAKMVEADETYLAVELLLQAAHLDPRREYFALLGRLQAQVDEPLWRRRASDNLRRAIDLGARDPGLHALLEQVEERLRAGEAPPPRAGKRAGRRDDEIELPLPA